MAGFGSNADRNPFGTTLSSGRMSRKASGRRGLEPSSGTVGRSHSVGPLCGIWCRIGQTKWNVSTTMHTAMIARQSVSSVNTTAALLLLTE